MIARKMPFARGGCAEVTSAREIHFFPNSRCAQRSLRFIAGEATDT